MCISQDSFDSYVENNWDIISDAFADLLDTSKNRTEQITQAKELVQDNIITLAVLSFVNAALLLTALIASGRIIGQRALIGSGTTVLSHMSLLGGMTFTGTAIFFIYTDDIVDGAAVRVLHAIAWHK